MILGIVSASQDTIEVTLAPPPDLVVSSIQADDVFVTGRTMTIQYNVSNVGAGEPFENYWQDIVVSIIEGVTFNNKKMTIVKNDH